MADNELDNAPLCPTCHSKISPTNKRTQGQDGQDSNGNNVPYWSDDPLYTPTGLNGEEYIGTQFLSIKHLKEIQDARKTQEEELGITPPTEFSTLDSTSLAQLTHLVELRMSTERILESIGVSLQEYFKKDADGNDQPAGPNDTADKIEWTDTKRGIAIKPNGLNSLILQNGNTQFKVSETVTRDLPSMDAGTTVIKGIHIEDLRHPISAVVFERFTNTEPEEFAEIISPGLNNFPNNLQEFYSNTTLISLPNKLLGNIYNAYSFTMQATTQGTAQNVDDPDPFVDQSGSRTTVKFLPGLLSGGSSRIIDMTFTASDHTADNFDTQGGFGRVTFSYVTTNNYIASPIRIRANSSGRLYMDYNFNNVGRLVTNNTQTKTLGFLSFKYNVAMTLRFRRLPDLTSEDARIILDLTAGIPVGPFASFFLSPCQRIRLTYQQALSTQIFYTDFENEQVTEDISVPYIPIDLSVFHSFNPTLFDTNKYVMTVEYSTFFGANTTVNLGGSGSPVFGDNIVTTAQFHGIKIK